MMFKSYFLGIKMTLTLVGDVHDRFDRYFISIEDSEYSLQLGDMSFDYTRLSEIDPNHHKFVGGNHDNYEIYDNQPHALGKYGMYTLGGIEFFFLRGAFSIDCKHRLARGMHWYPEEELTYQELSDAIELYIEKKPQIVFTHDAPIEISEIVGKPEVLRKFGFERSNSKTQFALQSMFEAHQPDLWWFGHFHRRWEDSINGTNFRCLDICEFDYI